MISLDPNVNVQEQRELANKLVNELDRPDSNTAEAAALGSRLAERVIALDLWRQSGGFDPYRHNVKLADINAKLSIDPAHELAQRTADYLTSTEPYGGAVWIMPNGYCRVGEPNAPMIERELAAKTIKRIMTDRVIAADVD